MIKETLTHSRFWVVNCVQISVLPIKHNELPGEQTSFAATDSISPQLTLARQYKKKAMAESSRPSTIFLFLPFFFPPPPSHVAIIVIMVYCVYSYLVSNYLR